MSLETAMYISLFSNAVLTVLLWLRAEDGSRRITRLEDIVVVPYEK